MAPGETVTISGGPMGGNAQDPHWADSAQVVGTPREVRMGEVIKLSPHTSGSFLMCSWLTTHISDV